MGSPLHGPAARPACQEPREPAEHVPWPSLYPICTVSQHHTSSCSASDAAHAFSSKQTAALATCLTGEAVLTHFSTLDTPQMAFDATGNREEQAPTVARWWAKHSKSLGNRGCLTAKPPSCSAWSGSCQGSGPLFGCNSFEFWWILAGLLRLPDNGSLQTIPISVCTY